jgi:hypothetical protein
MRLTQNGIAGLICLALSLGMLVLTRGLPQSSFVPVGPDFYPRRPGEAAPAAEAPVPEKRNYRLVGMTYAAFTGYVILLPLVGYRVATFVFVAALQAVFESPRGVRRWALVMVSALASSLVTYIVFNDYLSVLLPRGHWTGW